MAFADLAREHRIRPDEIRSVAVGRAIGTEGAFAVAVPRDHVAAQFSLPFALAALAYDVPPLAWGGSVADPAVLALSARVALRQDPRAVAEFAALTEPERRSPWSLRTHVEVVTDRGTYERWSDYKDMSDSEAAERTRTYGAGLLDPRGVDAMVDRALHLEEVVDVRDLTSTLARA